MLFGRAFRPSPGDLLEKQTFLFWPHSELLNQICILAGSPDDLCTYQGLRSLALEALKFGSYPVRTYTIFNKSRHTSKVNVLSIWFMSTLLDSPLGHLVSSVLVNVTNGISGKEKHMPRL